MVKMQSRKILAEKEEFYDKKNEEMEFERT